MKKGNVERLRRVNIEVSELLQQEKKEKVKNFFADLIYLSAQGALHQKSFLDISTIFDIEIKNMREKERREEELQREQFSCLVNYMQDKPISELIYFMQQMLSLACIGIRQSQEIDKERADFLIDEILKDMKNNTLFIDKEWQKVSKDLESKETAEGNNEK